jgi:hypothetical protein
LTSVTGQRRQHVARFLQARFPSVVHIFTRVVEPCARAVVSTRRSSGRRAASLSHADCNIAAKKRLAPARAFDSANTRRPWRVSVVGLRLLARHWAGVGAGLPLRLPLRDPLHRAHAHRPALQLGALRLLLAVVVFALVPRVVVPGTRDTRRWRE